MSPTTTNVALSALTCPGCDCRMCLTEAVRCIESLEGVVHVRLDRRGQAFVVRHDPALADETSIRSCVSATGLQIT